MECPKCGHINPDTAINCEECRINLDWAIQHLGKGQRSDKHRRMEERRKLGEDQSPMRQRRVTMLIFLGLAFLSLPLCCLPVVAFVPSYPLFWGRFTVINESDETLYITPIGERSGQRRVLLEHFSKFPYAPILKQADVRLDPQESVQLFYRWFDEPPWILTEIAVRNMRGEYRRMIIDKPTPGLWTSPEQTYPIESFGGLYTASPEVVEIAEKAGRFNFAAWWMIVAGLIPIGLFLAWLRLVVSLRRQSRNERQSTA
jgi:hypothetical protein